jgi:hypothetical protein
MGKNAFDHALVPIYLYTCRHYTCIGRPMSETTTIRVSKTTLKMLERLRQKMQASTLDEAIRLFITQQRKHRLDETFGVDKGKIKPFSEEDRGEDRN